jgi:hypothetical protein
MLYSATALINARVRLTLCAPAMGVFTLPVAVECLVLCTMMAS